jgi:hypothetical protein
VFYLSAVLFVVLIGMVWMTKPKLAQRGVADGGGAH